MEKIATIDVTGEIKLKYDENSPEFKEALEGYRKCIDQNGSKHDMLRHVAFYITRFGIDGMVEGVGYVGYIEKKPTEEPYSGILVGEDFNEFDFEIY